MLGYFVLVACAAAADITACHLHGSAAYCINNLGVEGEILPVPATVQSLYTACHLHGASTYCYGTNAEEVVFVPETSTDNSPSSQASLAHPVTTASTTTASSNLENSVTAVSGCHVHESALYCVAGDLEGYITPVSGTTVPTSASSFTGCEVSQTATVCRDAENQYLFVVEAGHAEETTLLSSSLNCHFHAGVEHCVGEDSHTCSRTDRDYNKKLRVGTLFAVLALSCVGVFLPIFLSRAVSMDSYIFTIVRQFGAGVILSTALVHLSTHAAMMFGNECLTIQYEGTSSAIVMAGIFLSFLVDFVSHRLLGTKSAKLEDADSVDVEENKMLAVMLEVGIIFHSVLIGVTLVVAGDSYYITLFIVVMFHQAFEGCALGSRIAELQMPMLTKLIMGAAFAITTPVGMAIGIGALNHFNGNDPSTVIAIGTLDAFSAGVLLWVALIEMLAHDWLNGPLMDASWMKVFFALGGLVAGMVLMSFLGKWA